jgi:outer membrane protein OmpA-like peptidoglycan-associated protein
LRVERGVAGLALAFLLALGLEPAAAQSSQGGTIQQPTGNWQVPGAIQQPTGIWQVPGAILVPKGIQAVRSFDEPCDKRLGVLGDALFDFDKAALRTDAEETLAAAGGEIVKAGKHPVAIEGHTDSIGGADYNMTLAENRARAVRDWLAAHRFVAADRAIKGYGKTRPIAPNTMPDGKDDPQGRQKNRRVEIVIGTCS